MHRYERETIQTLPLDHHALELIVQDHYLDTNVILRSCSKFHGSHAERSITINVNDHFVRRGDLCANSRREAEPHGLETVLA